MNVRGAFIVLTIAGAAMCGSATVGTAQAASYTCAAVAYRGGTDPYGDAFINRFDEEVAINEAGDVLFVGRAGEHLQTLYLYENGGPEQLLARDGMPAPGGSLFRRFGKRCFGHLALNDVGQAVFLARLALPGEGLFVLDGALEKAARTTDPSPSGGTFVSFPAASDIDDSGQVLFVGVVDGGPSGIFRYDATSNAVTALLNTTHVDDGARPFCEFQRVGLSDGLATFTATVGIPDCGTPVAAVLRLDGPGASTTIARAGESTPIGPTVTYQSFLYAPQSGTGTITFAARVVGSPFVGDALFSWDGATVSVVAKDGDVAPDVGGVLRRLSGQPRQTLAGDVFARVDTKLSSTRRVHFRFGATDQAVLVKTDSPPAPPFGGLALYRKLGPPAIDDDGSMLAVWAQVTDSFQPRSKNAILRCSP